MAEVAVIVTVAHPCSSEAEQQVCRLLASATYEAC